MRKYIWIDWKLGVWPCQVWCRAALGLINHLITHFNKQNSRSSRQEAWNESFAIKTLEMFIAYENMFHCYNLLSNLNLHSLQYMIQICPHAKLNFDYALFDLSPKCHRKSCNLNRKLLIDLMWQSMIFVCGFDSFLPIFFSFFTINMVLYFIFL